PMYAGPAITARVLPYGIKDLHIYPLSQLDEAARASPFLLFMAKSEGNPVNAGILQSNEFEVQELTAKEHGVLMWTDRSAELKAACGWPDRAFMVPPQSLVIYEARPVPRPSAERAP